MEVWRIRDYTGFQAAWEKEKIMDKKRESCLFSTLIRLLICPAAPDEYNYQSSNNLSHNNFFLRKRPLPKFHWKFAFSCHLSTTNDIPRFSVFEQTQINIPSSQRRRSIQTAQWKCNLLLTPRVERHTGGEEVRSLSAEKARETWLDRFWTCCYYYLCTCTCTTDANHILSGITAFVCVPYIQVERLNFHSLLEFSERLAQYLL